MGYRWAIVDNLQHADNARVSTSNAGTCQYENLKY
jgi:hypothetical protein